MRRPGRTASAAALAVGLAVGLGGAGWLALPAAAGADPATRVDDVRYVVTGRLVTQVSFTLTPVAAGPVYAWFDTPDWRTAVPVPCTTSSGRTVCTPDPAGPAPVAHDAQDLFVGLGSPDTGVLGLELTRTRNAGPQRPAAAGSTGLLPFTGTAVAAVALWGAVAVALGWGLVTAARQRDRSP